MEFLDQIITSIQKDPAPVVAVALAALIGTVAGSVILGLWGFFFRTIPKAIRVKCLPFCYGLFIKAQIRYRRWRSKQIMAAHLAGKPLTIPAQIYESCLAGNPLATDDSGLEAMKPPEPAWLNDYYLATALDTLSRESKIVRVREYHDSHWPPQIVNYQFWPSRADWMTAEEAREFERNGKCRAYQFSNVCPVGDRFNVRIIRETVSIRDRRFWTALPVKDSAPPCQRCWHTVARAQIIQLLVDSITEHDLKYEATIEITGENQEFQTAVIAVCCNGEWEPEIPTVKCIVERGVQIRRRQLVSSGLGQSTDWTEQLTAEFSAAVSAHIRDLQL